MPGNITGALMLDRLNTTTLPLSTEYLAFI
jgi:hypothetical protein